VINAHTDWQIEKLLPLDLKFANANFLCPVTNSVKHDLKESKMISVSSFHLFTQQVYQAWSILKFLLEYGEKLRCVLRAKMEAWYSFVNTAVRHKNKTRHSSMHKKLKEQSRLFLGRTSPLCFKQTSVKKTSRFKFYAQLYPTFKNSYMFRLYLYNWI
jgi:hypothetical protein